MNRNITKLVDELFSDMNYSKEICEAKEKVIYAFNKKYEEYKKDGNSIQALGKLMSEYGDINKACKLAGFTDEDIERWHEAKNVVGEKELTKFFRCARWQIYVLSILIIYSLIGLLNASRYEAFYIIIPLVPLFLLVRNLYKMRKKLVYGISTYSKEGKLSVDFLSDRYGKRLLNSICLAISTSFFVIYLYVVAVVKTGMTSLDAITSIKNGSIGIELVFYILVKNSLCKYFLNRQFNKQIRDDFRKYAVKTALISLGYWTVMVTTILLLRNKVDNLVSLMILAAVIYFILIVMFNLTLRKNVVFHNVTVNIKRCIAIGLCLVLVSSYQIMKMDSFILQPYISRVSTVANVTGKIDYDETSGVYTITSAKEDFKILQLTDIHLGGSMFSAIKDYKALEACNQLIDKTNPDFVVVTGDLVFPLGIMSFSLNNTAPIIEFSNFMRNKGVPWAFTYGNHDTEFMASGSVDDVKNTFKSLSYKTSGNLLYPYIEPDITGRNNQLIKIRNNDGSLNQALFLLDSNDYIYSMNNYDYIHDDEVDWYKSQIEKMNLEEGKQISSLLFFHMPLQEYRTAYELYENGSNEVTYYFGENKEKMINKVCCSDYPSKLFDTAKELGSTKAMFCGHDHYNNMSLEYEGIRLTYGMSIDYLAMPGIDKDTEQRGATLITLHKDSSYKIEQIKYGK